MAFYTGTAIIMACSAHAYRRNQKREVCDFSFYMFCLIIHLSDFFKIIKVTQIPDIHIRSINSRFSIRFHYLLFVQTNFAAILPFIALKFLPNPIASAAAFTPLSACFWRYLVTSSLFIAPIKELKPQKDRCADKYSPCIDGSFLNICYCSDIYSCWWKDYRNS